ncbi:MULTISPECIES: helix-turn-helix domain-containing protein [Delftia]|uniref:helix-turn-helix domain-containing protein n=1 Tax=Delftia TaxID=80865 RepID=UPI000F846B17|nr:MULTISPECIES: helix-turn-helix domain-containing protein [Delftia]WEM00992.1 helix-turn-helix domain-containing protein [Delftia tsuruhatensis]
MSNTDTLNLREAADILKVHVKTAEDMAREGTIPAAKIGRAYVFMRRDVVRFAEQAINKQTADRILKRSPKRVRKVRSTQVRVAH